MSLRKRARSLRRADSASELPILRETMATPAAMVSISQEDGEPAGSPILLSGSEHYQCSLPVQVCLH